MFEAIASQWLPVYGINGQQAPIGMSDNGQAPQENNWNDLGYSGDQNNWNGSDGLNDQFLKSIGWTGGSPYIGTPGNGGGENGADVNPGYTPEFQQFLQQSGITFKQQPYGNDHMELQAFGPDGQPIGTPLQQKMYSPESDTYAGLLFGAGLGGFGALAAGAGGAAGAAGAADVGGLAGTGLPAYAANPYAYAPSLTADAAGGLTEGSIAAGGSGAAADAAGMGLAEGAYPASITAASPSLMSQAGSALSGVQDWTKANPFLTNLGGTVANGLIGAYSSNKALNAQTDATNQANALWAPYRETGTNALGRINGLMTNPSSITSDPGYQFGLNQGVQAQDRSANSKGSLYSGATQKALTRYGQDYAGTKLNDAYARYGNVAQLGATGTTNMSNNLTNLGNAGAGAALYQGNVLQNGVNNALGQWNFQNGGYGQPWNQSTYKPGP